MSQRRNPPHDEVPHALAWSAVLGRGADVVVALAGARLHSTGILLEIIVRARVPVPGGLFEAVLDTPGSDQLLLGARFADGRTTVAAEEGSWSLARIPGDEPALFAGGASGSDLTVDAAYFLTPLPPPGPLTLTCTWPGAGIVSNDHTFDASTLPTDMGRVTRLWT